MCDDQDISVTRTLKLHNNRLESRHDVAIRLSTSVSVVELILISGLEVFRVFVGDLLISVSIVSNNSKHS